MLSKRSNKSTVKNTYSSTDTAWGCFGLVFLALVIVGIFRQCFAGGTTNPESLAKQYLNHIRSGNLDAAKKLHCLPSNIFSLEKITEFEIGESKTQKFEHLGDKYEDISYSRVNADIRTNQNLKKKNGLGEINGGETMPEHVVSAKVMIWKSDDFYRFVNTARSECNSPSCYARNPDTRKKVKEAIEDSLLDRNEVSENYLCVEDIEER